MIWFFFVMKSSIFVNEKYVFWLRPRCIFETISKVKHENTASKLGARKGKTKFKFHIYVLIIFSLPFSRAMAQLENLIPKPLTNEGEANANLDTIDYEDLNADEIIFDEPSRLSTSITQEDSDSSLSELDHHHNLNKNVFIPEESLSLSTSSVNKENSNTHNAQETENISIPVPKEPTTSITEEQSTKGFDLQTLEALGYSSDVAEFFGSGSKFLPGTHTVKIIVNAANAYRVDANFNEAGQLCVDETLLATLKLRPLERHSNCTDLQTLWPTTEIKSHPGQFLIELMVPEVAFDPIRRGTEFERGGYALLLNYNLFGQQITGTNNLNFFQGQFEAGINFKNWIVRNRIFINNGLGGNSFSNEEVYAARSVEKLKSIVQFGQLSSQSTSFSGLPILGVQLFSDTAQYESTQLVVPIIGTAETNATIELRQRGRLIYRTIVPAGPFSLSQISNFSNGVPVDMEIIEQDGRRRQFTVANAVDISQQPSATSFQIGMGRYHNTSGNDGDTPLLVMVEAGYSLRAGQRFTNGLILSSDYQSIVMRANQGVGEQGWIAGGVNYARAKDNRMGVQLDMQAQTQINGNISASLSTLFQSKDFLTADEAYSTDSQSQNIKNSSSAALTFAHPRWGALSYSASYNQYHQDQKNNISQTVTLSKRWGRATVSANFQTATNRKNSTYLNISLPLGGGQFSSRAQNVNKETTVGVTYQNTLGSNGSYSVGATNSKDETRVNGSANINTPYSKFVLSLSQSDNQSRSISMSAIGSVAYANNAFATSSSPIGDTFAIVTIPKQSNLGIQAPGSGKALTNYAGAAILPSLPAYTTVMARVETKTMPLNIRLESTTTEFTLARGTVASKNLSATEMRQVLLSIRDEEGSPVPLGATVTDKEGKFLGIIVGDGNLMLSNNDIGKELRIKIPNQSDCSVSYTAPNRFDSNELYEEAAGICRY